MHRSNRDEQCGQSYRPPAIAFPYCIHVTPNRFETRNLRRIATMMHKSLARRNLRPSPGLSNNTFRQHDLRHFLFLDDLWAQLHIFYGNCPSSRLQIICQWIPTPLSGVRPRPMVASQPSTAPPAAMLSRPGAPGNAPIFCRLVVLFDTGADAKRRSDVRAPRQHLDHSGGCRLLQARDKQVPHTVKIRR
jgi:hypothetical protein